MSKVDDNRLRRAGARAGYKLSKFRGELWLATTTRRNDGALELRIVSPKRGLDYDEMTQWLAERIDRHGSPTGRAS